MILNERQTIHTAGTLAIIMRKAFYILFILTFFVNCQSETKVSFIKKHTILVDNDYCDISFYYPELDVDEDSLDLNEILYHIPDYEFYSHRCEKKSDSKKVVKGDYEIVYQDDSLVSIEFLTIKSYENVKVQDTIYHSIVMNIKSEKKNKWELLWGESPELILKNFDRGKLKPYVKKYNQTSKYGVNILAYETESRYNITWGMTKDDFLLYVGGEGEAFGYDKLVIPFKNLKY